MLQKLKGTLFLLFLLLLGVLCLVVMALPSMIFTLWVAGSLYWVFGG